MCFAVKFAKFLRTHFLKEHLWWLLLKLLLAFIKQPFHVSQFETSVVIFISCSHFLITFEG